MSEKEPPIDCQHVNWTVHGWCQVGDGWCEDCGQSFGLDTLVTGSMSRIRAEEKKLNAALELLKRCELDFGRKG